MGSEQRCDSWMNLCFQEGLQGVGLGGWGGEPFSLLDGWCLPAGGPDLESWPPAWPPACLPAHLPAWPLLLLSASTAAAVSATCAVLH